MNIDPLYVDLLNSNEWQDTRPNSPERYAKLQRDVETSYVLENGQWARPTGPDDKRDRYVGQLVFSWDKNANHGSGAWLETGKLNPDANPLSPNFDPSRDIHWFDQETLDHQYGADFYQV